MEQQSGFYSDLLYFLGVIGSEDAYKILAFLILLAWLRISIKQLNPDEIQETGPLY